MKGKRTSFQKFAVLKAMLADAELSAAAKVVGTSLLIQFHNNKTGRCNPSFASIARAVGRSRRVIFPAIEELKTQHWIDVKGTGGGAPGTTNAVIFNFGRVKSAAPLTGEANNIPTGAANDTGDVERRDGCSTPHTNKEEPLSPSEREWDSACALAPDGAALASQFEQLCKIWSRPYGNNETKASKAFALVCANHEGQEVIASAERWVANTESRFLMKLEEWLGNGAWCNDPKPKQARGARGKPNPVDEMLNAGGMWRGGE